MSRKKKKDKTLLEVLETFDKKQIVAIGPKSGTGFVYIGEAGDTKMITKAYSDYLRKVKKTYTKAKGNLEYLVSNPLNLDDMDEKDRNEKILNRGKAVHDAYRTFMNSDRYIKTYVDPFEREVAETYHKEVDNCTAIIIKGTETGDFWDLSEFEKKYKK